MIKFLKVLWLKSRGYQKTMGVDFGNGSDESVSVTGYQKNGKTVIVEKREITVSEGHRLIREGANHDR